MAFKNWAIGPVYFVTGKSARPTGAVLRTEDESLTRRAAWALAIVSARSPCRRRCDS